MRAQELSDGVRMVLPASRIRMDSRTLPLRSGTKKSRPATKEVPKVVSLTIYSDFLKERLFGLSNPQGNHGESIKEAHFHVDNTPTVRSPATNFGILLTDF